jgi:uncharacterized integral membrane protein
MSSKTIFIIVVTILVTIILMKNTDEVSFWIFGNHSVPKLAVLGVMFGVGLILGYMAGRPKKAKELPSEDVSMLDQAEEDKWIDPNEDYIN